MEHGVSVISVIGIVFIILKLVGVINWSWWWVLAPLWIPLAIVAVVFIILLIVKIITFK